jgi:tetratricopeptide (TPR) repeat protein
MRVAPLTPEGTNALFGVLAERAGDRSPAVPSELTSAVTGGNPLFVLELVRHVRETGQATSLPQSLRELIRDRAARLTPIARHVLHTCAVLGRYSSVPRVASVLELGTADLLACIGELDALGIVGTSHDAEALSIHDLWREELLKRMLPAAKKLLHHRCGLVLEGECRITRSPAVVWEAARHLLESGSEGRALSLLEECAQHQMDNGLPADAATTFELAEQASTNDADRFRSMTGRITALRRAANWTELARVVEPAIELSARSAMVWSRHSDLELLRLEVQWWTETAPESSLDHALSCVNDETASASHRISAALLSMIISANLARLDELASTLRIVEALPQDAVEDRINVLSATMIYHTEAGDLDVALAAATALISAERERGSVRGLTRALRFASYPLRCLGDYATAMTLLRESLELAERHLLVGDAASASDSIVNMCLEQDDIPAAQRWVARAKSWSSLVRARYARTSPSINDALIALAMGNYAAVESLVDADLDSHSRDPVIRQKLLHLSALVRLFSHRAETRRLARACDLLGEALRQASTIGRLDYVVASYAAGLVTLGNSAAAVEFVRRYLSDHRRDRSTPSRQLARFVDDASVC